MMAWVDFPVEGFEWVGPGGEPKWFKTFQTTKRGFCDECGSTVAAIDDGGTMMGVTMMALCVWVVIDQHGIRPARRRPSDVSFATVVGPPRCQSRDHRQQAIR
jgi:hypothetical protein